MGPSHKAAARFGSRSHSTCVPQENGAEKGDIFMSYLNSVTIVGFVGADPEQRQARNNGSKFTVLSVATQRSWKNAQDEWSSKTAWHRICVIWNLDESQGRSRPVQEGQSSQKSWSSGAFAPTPCAGSAALKPKCRRRRPAPKLAPSRATRRTDHSVCCPPFLPTSGNFTPANADCRGYAS